VGDLVKTIVVDTCAVAGLARNEVIQGAIVPGLSIVGLSSSGKATYEEQENSGIGSNGLTSARHDLLCSYYRERYPESYDHQLEQALVYCGPYHLNDPLPESNLSVGEALLSPTRTYAPLICKMLKEKPDLVKGLIHCTGGGQGKCLRFGKEVFFVKDNLFAPPPIFRAIQDASGTSRREMYQVFNMGHRMEVYCLPSASQEIIAMASQFGIEAKEIGHTQASRKNGANHLLIKAGGEELEY